MSPSEMSDAEVCWRIQELKRFKKCSRKIHFICKCDDSCIFVLSELIRNFLDNKFKIKNIKRILQKLLPLRFNLRRLADSKVSSREKRKILIDFGFRALVYPILQKVLIPYCLMLDGKKKT